MGYYYVFSINSFRKLYKEEEYRRIREGGGILRTVAERMDSIDDGLKENEIRMILQSAIAENPSLSSKIKLDVNNALESMRDLKDNDFCLCPFVFNFGDLNFEDPKRAVDLEDSKHAVTLIFTKEKIYVFDTGPEDKKKIKIKIIKQNIRNVNMCNYSEILINDKTLQHKKGCAFYTFYFIIEASKYKDFNSLHESIKSGRIQCDIASNVSNITRFVQYTRGKKISNKELETYKYLPKFIKLKSFQICPSEYCRIHFDENNDYAFLSEKMDQTYYINKTGIINSTKDGKAIIIKQSNEWKDIKKQFEQQYEIKKEKLEKCVSDKEINGDVYGVLLNVIKKEYEYNEKVIKEQLNYFKKDRDGTTKIENIDEAKVNIIKKHSIENELFGFYKEYINCVQEIYKEYNKKETSSVISGIFKNKIPTPERLLFEENLLKKHHEYELKFIDELKFIKKENKEFCNKKITENIATELLEKEKIAFYDRIMQYENNFIEYEMTGNEKNLLKMDNFYIDSFSKVNKYYESKCPKNSILNKSGILAHLVGATRNVKQKQQPTITKPQVKKIDIGKHQQFYNEKKNKLQYLHLK